MIIEQKTSKDTLGIPKRRVKEPSEEPLSEQGFSSSSEEENEDNQLCE